MTAAQLVLAFTPDDDGTGELAAFVRSGDFAGRGCAWFDRQYLRETFVAALKSFPITADAPATIEGGYWSKESRGVLDQCHLRIVVKPYDSRGTLLVKVDLASETPRNTPDVDRQHAVTVRFLAEYAAVAVFADALAQALDGISPHATLNGMIA